MIFDVISKERLKLTYSEYTASTHFLGWNGAYSITNLHPRHVLWGSRTWIAAVCIGRVICKGVDVMEICNFGGGLCPQKSVNWCLTAQSSQSLYATPCNGLTKRKITLESVWLLCLKQSEEVVLSALFCKLQTNTTAAKWTVRCAIVFPSAVSTAGLQIRKLASKLILIRGCETRSWRLKLPLPSILRARLRSVISWQPGLFQVCSEPDSVHIHSKKARLC